MVVVAMHMPVVRVQGMLVAVVRVQVVGVVRVVAVVGVVVVRMVHTMVGMVGAMVRVVPAVVRVELAVVGMVRPMVWVADPVVRVLARMRMVGVVAVVAMQVVVQISGRVHWQLLLFEGRCHGPVGGERLQPKA